MIIPRRIQDATALAELFQGTTLATGKTGTTETGENTLQDLTEGAFAAVSAGNRIYLSGENTATIFLVDSKVDDNNLVLSQNTELARTGTGMWKACLNNAVAVSDVPFPIIPIPGGSFLILQDASTFYFA